MACGSCGSANQMKFGTETNIHFSGLLHLENPGILIFPEVAVCLDCGFAYFNLRKSELGALKEGVEGRTPQGRTGTRLGAGLGVVAGNQTPTDKPPALKHSFHCDK